ncbi:MAG: ABC transporter substrate-binding protein, partial [Ilumatobacteraceae bacterium]
MKRSVRVAFAGIAALSLFVAACGGSDDEAAEETCTTTTPVKLQLQWFTQAQFAGYYAAVDQG